ncbi:ankyrin repeat and SOCS box protein 12 [Bombina bombina]|uniref:ankyrin repeat and SOCS box protein 12 n=1 Tax=Bombina bombina TaxID=8345 RepID=UPI00235AB3EF|nr:ankyrin repeat and SOCS box protein 12 [Bombina bombina]
MLQLKGHEDDLIESKELHLAVSLDQPQHLSELLSHDKYRNLINASSGWGIPVTPLRLAAAKGFVQCLKVLLDNGAEVDSLDVKAQTPLYIAVNYGHLDCVSELLKAGANPGGSIYNNASPILIAAREGNASILRELLEYGANANVRPKVPDWAFSSSISTGPLYFSAVYDHLECFRTLLLYGADPNYNCTDMELLKKIKNPKSVVEHCLQRKCSTQFVELLIEFGANVYLPDLNNDEEYLKHDAMKLLLRERAHPRPLMSQCRLTIRKQLMHPGKKQVIGQLNIPDSMVKYLYYET